MVSFLLTFATLAMASKEFYFCEKPGKTEPIHLVFNSASRELRVELADALIVGTATVSYQQEKRFVYLPNGEDPFPYRLTLSTEAQHSASLKLVMGGFSIPCRLERIVTR